MKDWSKVKINPAYSPTNRGDLTTHPQDLESSSGSSVSTSTKNRPSNHLVYIYERERNVLFNTFYLRLYGVRHIWLRTILIVRKETRCRHIGYSYRVTARVLLYAPSHRQGNTYHGLCYTSRGALAGTRNMYIYIYRQIDR